MTAKGVRRFDSSTLRGYVEPARLGDSAAKRDGHAISAGRGLRDRGEALGQASEGAMQRRSPLPLAGVWVIVKLLLQFRPPPQVNLVKDVPHYAVRCPQWWALASQPVLFGWGILRDPRPLGLA